MNKNGRKNLEIDIASLGGHVYSKKQVGWPVKAISLHFLLSPICQAYSGSLASVSGWSTYLAPFTFCFYLVPGSTSYSQ